MPTAAERWIVDDCEQRASSRRPSFQAPIYNRSAAAAAAKIRQGTAPINVISRLSTSVTASKQAAAPSSTRAPSTRAPAQEGSQPHCTALHKTDLRLMVELPLVAVMFCSAKLAVVAGNSARCVVRTHNLPLPVPSSSIRIIATLSQAGSGFNPQAGPEPG